MNKELKVELFNIYDVVIFEDENGITQDCVCSIWKDELEKSTVDVVECNDHSISIYENGSYRVWGKDGKDLPYYSTNKKIIHLYTLKNDNRFYDIYPINDYAEIDNVNDNENDNENDKVKKTYLTWEDLKFTEENQTTEVLLNGVTYSICFYRFTVVGQNEVNIYTKGLHIVTLNGYYPEDIKFFNDLRLERVEE